MKTLYFKSFHKLTHDTIWKLIVEGDKIIDIYYYVTDDPIYATDGWKQLDSEPERSLSKFISPSTYWYVIELTEKEAFLEIL